MNSRLGSGGAPAACEKASNSVHRSRWTRSYSAQNSAQPEGSAVGYPEKTGGIAGSRTSSGLHETIRTHGRPHAGRAGKLGTLSSQITSGSSSVMISSRRGFT